MVKAVVKVIVLRLPYQSDAYKVLDAMQID